MDIPEDKVEFEQQFILRLPFSESIKIRQMLNTKSEKVKKQLKIDLRILENIGTVHIGKTKLNGVINKFPTIIESYKTNLGGDRSAMFKTADICQMLDCSSQENIDDKKVSMHGYCPPLKNVKKNRFRKTMYNTELATETESVTKELYYLLSTDLEAVFSRYEIINEGSNVHSAKEYEKSLFGQLSSDSENENSN